MGVGIYFSRMKQVETKSGSYSLLLSNLLTVPGATGSADFSFRGSNMQNGAGGLTDTTEHVLERLFIDNLGDLGWSQSAVEAEEVCGETSDERSGHGRSRDHFGLPIVPGGNDVQARSPDVNWGTITGEVGLHILDSGSGDGNRLLNAGGRVIARVTATPGGHDDGNTAVVKLGVESLVSIAVAFYPFSAYRYDSPVRGDRSTTTQAHRSNRGFAGPRCFLGDPVNAGDTVVQRRGSVAVGDKKGGRRLTRPSCYQSPDHSEPLQR